MANGRSYPQASVPPPTFLSVGAHELEVMPIAASLGRPDLQRDSASVAAHNIFEPQT